MKLAMNIDIKKSNKGTTISSLTLVAVFQLMIVVAGLSYSAPHLSPIVQTANAQVDEAFKTYENPKFGLTVSYPPNWSVDELRNDPAAASNNSIVAIFKSPSQGQNDKYLENVIVNIQGPRPDISSLEVYTQNSEKAFNNMSDTIKITKSGKDTLAGLPAHQLLYTSTGIPGLNLEKMQVFTVVNNNTAYVVTYGAEQAEYDKNIQDVEKLINSIKIDRDAMENVQVNQADKPT
jgi:serine/threonine-protein kinase